MPIVENDTLEFSTAATIIRPPVVGAECPKFPSLEELVKEEETVGRGCTIRSACGWAKRTVVQIGTHCWDC